MARQALKFFETKEFKALQAKWYKKAQLQTKEPSPTPTWEPVVFTAKQEYYRLIYQYVAQEKFDNGRDRHIMKLWAEGFLKCEIQEALSQRGIEIHRQTIRFIIRRYENKWGLRHWEKSQLTTNQVIAS